MGDALSGVGAAFSGLGGDISSGLGSLGNMMGGMFGGGGAAPGAAVNPFGDPNAWSDSMNAGGMAALNSPQNAPAAMTPPAQQAQTTPGETPASDIGGQQSSDDPEIRARQKQQPTPPNIIQQVIKNLEGIGQKGETAIKSIPNPFQAGGPSYPKAPTINPATGQVDPPIDPTTDQPQPAQPNIPIGGGAGNVQEAPTGTAKDNIPIGGGEGNKLEAPTGTTLPENVAANPPLPPRRPTDANVPSAAATPTSATTGAGARPGEYQPSTGNARQPTWVPGGPSGGGAVSGGQNFDAGNFFRFLAPLLQGVLPMLMQGMMGGGRGPFGGFGPGMMPFMRPNGGFRGHRGGWLGPGYYPNRQGGVSFHPGGYHPGWPSSGAHNAAARYGANWAANRYGPPGSGSSRINPSGRNVPMLSMPGDNADSNASKQYLSSLSANAGREGDTSRMNPVMANRLANAFREARSKGLNVTLASGFRTPGQTGSAFDARGESQHSYGMAADVGGIGPPGSATAAMWHDIATRNGLFNPYWGRDPKEWNHYQLLPYAFTPNDPAMQQLRDAYNSGNWDLIAQIEQALLGGQGGGTGGGGGGSTTRVASSPPATRRYLNPVPETASADTTPPPANSNTASPDQYASAAGL